MFHRYWYLTFLVLLFTQLLPPAPAQADGFPILGTLHAGKRPEAMAVDTQTHLLYIAHESPGLVVAFDPLKDSVRWRSTLGDVATDVEVDSQSHHVYVTSISYEKKQSNLSVLDGATGQVLSAVKTGSGDNGIALDAQRRRAYVSSVDSGIVYIFTFLTGWQRGPISIQTAQLHIGSHPEGLGVNSRLGRLYVTDIADHILTVLDEDSERIITTLPVASTPLHPLRVDEASGRVYIVCSGGQELDIVDGKTNRMLTHTSVAPYPEGIAIHTASGRIYVANEGNGEGTSDRSTGTTIAAIDSTSFAVLGTLTIGLAPNGIEADPDLRRIYVALEDSDAVIEMSDSTDLPLKGGDNSVRQAAAARQTITLLQQATTLTLIAMVVTVVWATLFVLLRRWRGRESPQTQPVHALVRSETHIPAP